MEIQEVYHEHIGVYFELPIDWKMVPQERKNMAAYASAQIETQIITPKLIISQFETPNNEHRFDLQLSEEIAKSAGKEHEFSVRTQERLIDGKTGIVDILTFLNPEKLVHVLRYQIFMQLNLRVVSFTGISNANVSDQVIPIYEHVEKSIRFK